MSSTSTTRRELAADLAEDLDDAWHVYSEPPANVTVPAIVIGPRDPYIVRATVKAWDLQLVASIVVAVAAPSPLDEIDRAIDALRTAVLARSDVRWESVRGPQLATQAGVEQIVAGVDIVISYKPEG